MSGTPRATGPPRPESLETGTAQRQRPQGEHGVRAALAPPTERPNLLVLAPGVVYLAVRFFGMLVLAVLSAADGESFANNLRVWDAQWYLEIAAGGYGEVDPGMVDGHGNRTPETPLAFFPGYPLFARLFTVVPGISVSGAAITASLAAGVACAYGLARLARRVSTGDERHRRRVGLLLVALFAAAPMSIVLSMPYSEALFCALAVWALVGAVEQRWLLAGAACAAAGLVRPTAAALIAVIGLAAVVALVQAWRNGRGPVWPPVAAIALAPAGMLTYLGWVAIQTGDLNGYFELQQRGWSSSFDGGAATLGFVVETLAGQRSAFETFTVWIVLAALVLLVLCLQYRLPWPLVLFAALVVVMDLGSDGLMYSKVRLLLPAFPLLLPLALGLANRRTTTAVTSTVLFACFGSWFSAYALTIWEYAI